MGQAQVQRRQGQRLVVDHLHRGAATAEHHHRTEGGVVGQAADQFARLGLDDHRLHQHAVDARIRPRLACTLQDPGGRFAHRRGAGQVQPHAAHVGLVHDVLRQDLQGHRLAPGQQRLGRGHCRIGIGGAHRRGHRDAIGLQQGGDLDRVQPVASLRQRRGHHRLGGGGIDGEVVRQARRGFHQQPLRLLVAHQVGIAAHRIDLGGVGRHPGRVQPRLGLRLGTQPHAQHRLAGARARPARQHRGHRIGGFGGGGQRGGHVHHQHRVVARILQQRFQGDAVTGRVGIADDVHRIGARPGRRQHRVQALHRGRVQHRQGAAQVDQPVHRQHADAAAIGQDRQPLAGGLAQVSQGFGGGEQLVQRQHPQQAGTTEGGVVDRVGAGQRTGMGRRSLGALRVAPGLDHHHRLGTRGRACGGHELARVPDRLDVEQDCAGFRILGEPVQQVAEIHVHRVAQRDHRRKTDRTRPAPLHQTGGDRTGL